ncbi:2-polyprenyl-6-methoxyphenol hydroxylase [Streptomyces sp. TLI_053]|uniref:FAD-dependent monooxygenase n=1 Tax=Streptomyces sp. TLI_053 TaxID=1855352 RepID=UPI00087C868B|nr:FAD-dependent monooxygenase [Streptomyces sp. TLI_053]SDT51597.1 2-polyprenyl-6-methoxyphenol hydroxylase [Streptomyces sp. TLI_053]
MQNVLVSGGGIAGTFLAHWLARRGFAPTVVELAPGPRTGGQAVDIRGVALDVIERTGLTEQVRAVRTRMRGMSVLGADGTELHRSEESTYSSGRLDSEDVELLRSDLLEILYDHTPAGVEFVHGDSVTSLQEDARGVHVTFAHGRPRTFDLVVGADGLHSRVRRLAFGAEERFLSPLGTHLAIFGADNFLGLEDWQVWQRDGDAGYGIYPVRGNTELRIVFGWGSDAPAERDPEAARKAVADRIAALSWERTRLLDALHRSTDFYADVMAQVHLDSWSAGRTVLLGDAGYCASPLSGQGTSLALVGAYVLAQELGRARDHGTGHRAAYGSYERRMRPFVTLNQALATENPGGPAAEESVERAKNAILLDAA